MYVLLGTLLSVVFFDYQTWGAAQTNVLLMEELDHNEERQQRALRELRKLLEDAIANPTLNTTRQFVARDRVALVRVAPLTGADIVGRVFPRQSVVAAVDRGK